MGMAASQARLLTITARLADNELRSQTINNAKMRLATQSSQASEDYISALNNATMKFSNYDATGATVSQDLTYNALTAYSSYNTQYGLSNSSGQILVSEDEAAMFANANGDINAYLKAHGLEYTTTYFNEIGTISNEDYPSPFDSIDSETLQSYYESYGSYQASLEVQDYAADYKAYASADSALTKGAATFFNNYLTAAGNSTVINYDSDTEAYSMVYDTKTTLTPTAILAALKTAFMGTNSNTYNLNNLVANQFISSSNAQEIKDLLNSFDIVGYSQLQYSENVNFSGPVSNDNGNKVYTLDDFIKVEVDSDGNVVGVTADQTVLDLDTGENVSVYYPAISDTNPIQFESFVNSMGYTDSYTEDDSTETTSYSYKLSKDENDNYSLKSSTVISSTMDDLKNTSIPAILEEVFGYLNSDLISDNFIDYLLDQGADNVKSAYGIDVNQAIDKNGKSISTLLSEYIQTRDDYVSLIFDNDSKDQVIQDLKAGTVYTTPSGENLEITAKNLSDMEFVLKYLNAAGLNQSEAFETIIKESIVDKVIEEYGEPKYAWVDENDTSNTGNADAKAQWYTNLFTRMQQGYKALENGLAASKEWIEYALESGIVTLEQVDTNYNWNSLSYGSCTKITEETDDAAVTKAEAEYNRAMNDIEAKDNIYDIELKNIDTEHTSLQTEYDVIKDVMKKNIERTFKFNQSA